MNQEKIPHYVDPSTIKSKFANTIARMADYAWWRMKHRNHVVVLGFYEWWLMKHRNHVVDLGFDYKDGALGGGTLLAKSLDGVIADCTAYVDMTAKGGKLRTIYVNGGNGEDRPGIPIYTVTL